MHAVKFAVCNVHPFKVWYPAGLKCPACHPEDYPVVDQDRPGSILWLAPGLSYSHPAKARTNGQPFRPDLASPPRQSRE